ncbi:MAG: efflux RND transporter permease subunit [Planctomycetota bacterium]|nr:MAG: efflux RND transporter permease subunit [Planctomycetota bacterium]
MIFSRWSVARPVATSMATLIVVLVGAVALTRLPIDLLPDVTMPALSVVTNYENASPEEIEQLISEPVENALSAVPGVEEIFSTSSEGISSVRLSFLWGTDIDVASNDVRDRLDRVRRNLPEDADLPQLRKFDPANFPIVLLGVASQLDPIELTELIEARISNRLARLPGVAQVDTWGGFHREIQVQLDRERLSALNLSLDTILTRIRSANLNVPVGSVDRDRLEVTIRTPGEFQGIDELANTVVAHSSQGPVLLSDLAQVKDTHRKITRIIRINGERGVRLAVRKQSGVNTAEVAQRVIAEVEHINRDVAQAEVVTLFNQAAFIERSIANVTRSVLFGGALAVLVLLFFLRNLRSTLIVGMAIPISVVATFGLIHFAGFTLNLMTLGGLALGVGMMVDSSIVVLENIFRRRREENESHTDSAVQGASEVATAIIASTITTLVIFLPLVFAQGASSILFQQLAAVIAFALVCSLVVSLTVVPMLAKTILPPDDQPRGPAWIRRLSSAAGRAFDALDRTYRDLLRMVLRHRLLVIVGVLITATATLPLLRGIGTELMPPSDEGEVRVNAEMEVGTRLAIMDEQARRIEDIIRQEVPELQHISVSVGPSGWRPSSSAEASFQISLGPAAQRSRSNSAIAADLRRALEGQTPGTTVRVRAPQGLRILNRIVGTGDESLAVEIFGPDMAALDDLSEQVIQAVSAVSGVTDAVTTREVGVPQELLRIDRDRAADAGVSVQDIARTLETAISGSRAGDFRDGGDAVRILVRLADGDVLALDDLLDLTVMNPDGRAIPVRSVATVEQGTGPMLIERKDQQRMVSVAINTSGRDLGALAADIHHALSDIPLPAGYSFVLAGNYEEQQQAFRELLIAMLLALVLVYMVLASQYESLRDPLVVMFSVPLAGIGVILMLFLTGTTLNVQSYIGCIMLGGIVVNNAILLVDQAGRLRERGLSSLEAAAEAGRRRLRPILMTTATTILGLLPLALGWGEGAEAQAPLARAVIGGLFTSTMITLILIPALYSLAHPQPVEKRVA